MDVDGGTITAIGGIVAAAAASVGGGIKVLADKIGARFEKIETKLEECNSRHVEDRELIGGLKAELQGIRDSQRRETERREQNTQAIEALKTDHPNGR